MTDEQEAGLREAWRRSARYRRAVDAVYQKIDRLRVERAAMPSVDGSRSSTWWRTTATIQRLEKLAQAVAARRLEAWTGDVVRTLGDVAMRKTADGFVVDGVEFPEYP